jgi:predicted enzyme related to lactoylglutathione lyase
MKVIEIAFTGYPVTDIKKSRQFYEDILMLKPTMVFGDEKSAWVEYDIGPGTLAISNMAPDWKASPGGGCAGLEVDDFEAAVKHLRAKGVKFLNGPFDSPVCHMLIISDPDGNSLTIHKRKAQAAGTT